MQPTENHVSEMTRTYTANKDTCVESNNIICRTTNYELLS